MKIVLPGNSLHEVLHFVGYSRLLPEAPHTIFLPKQSRVGRDELHRLNCLHLFPWIFGFVHGLPDDLNYDLDLRPALPMESPYSYPVLFALFCGEYPPQLHRPFLETIPPDEKYAVVSREMGLKNDLFPWREVCEHLNKTGHRIIFWGDDSQYDLLRQEVGGVPLDFEPRAGLQELYELMSGACMYAGTQGEALFFSEALGLPQVVEVSHRYPDSIVLRSGSWPALADRVVMPDGERLLGSKPNPLCLFSSALLSVPYRGWAHPLCERRGLKNFDLDLFAKILKKRFSLPDGEKQIRDDIIAYTAQVDPRWAFDALYGRLFHRSREALFLAGNNLPLTEYLPPPNLDPDASCHTHHQREPGIAGNHP